MLRSLLLLLAAATASLVPPCAAQELLVLWRERCDADRAKHPELRDGRALCVGLDREAEQLFERSLRGTCADGGRPVDLRRYSVHPLDERSSAKLALERLRADPRIEHVERRAALAPPPGDIAPPTPSFHARQHYLAEAPAGVGAAVAARALGGLGAARRIVDIEWSWHRSHEDIAALATAPLFQAPAAAVFTDHGTASIGLIAADPDLAGIRGIASDAAIGFSSPNAAAGYSVARALLAAQSFLRAGDVVLLEVQARSPLGLVPAEFDRADFDAIRNLVAAGVHVIEPAGNGSVDLDDPFFGGLFDRAQRDSGAILVAAADGATPQRSNASSFGSRVDVNAHGLRVTTTGFGDLFDPVPTPDQRYTATFSGTSAASAITAGVALQVLGAHAAQLAPFGAAPLTPLELRDLLRRTGTPPATALEQQQIGRRVDAANALRSIGASRGLHLLDDALLGASVRLELAPRELAFLADAFALFGSLASQPVAFPAPSAPCGRFLLDPLAFFELGTGLVPNGPLPPLVFAIPADPALRELRVVLQAFYVNAAGASLCSSAAQVLSIK
ncbi:MAG: S8 family serine peptidase [Planctomycetes bacterium]|nr:S8 family serine peptidase [Planctomycetota bacterium]